MNKKMISISLVIILASTWTAYAFGSHIYNENIDTKKEKVSQEKSVLAQKEEKKENISFATEKLENITESYRENVLSLDTYYSFVTGDWPRLYLSDLIKKSKEGSELVDWAVEKALNNYSSNVRKTWDESADEESFFETASAVQKIYKFITSNVEYKLDKTQFGGRKEVYYPPDVLIQKIKDNQNAYGDCEDMALLATTMLSKLNKKRPELDIKNIRTKEGIVKLPKDIQVYVIETWKGLVPLSYDVSHGYYGHAYVRFEIPHPTEEYMNIPVTLPLTQKMGDQNVPWSTWVEGSPEALKIKENGWTIASPIESVSDLEIPYPLQGYDGGYQEVEYDVWRQYGPNFLKGYRFSDQFPDKNLREDKLRGDPMYDWDQDFEMYHGTYNLADTGLWEERLGYPYIPERNPPTVSELVNHYKN